MQTYNGERLYVIGVNEKAIASNQIRVTFHTTRGSFDGLACVREGMHKGVIMLGDTTGGFDGPSSVYNKLAEDMFTHDIASLRLDYRLPGDCVQCGIDTLLGVQYLDDEAIHDIAIIGWSFGGAVALAAGSVARNVQGIAAISTMDVADCCLRRLKSKSVLLIHGEMDRISPIDVSRCIYASSCEPRRFIAYPDTGHDLQEETSRLYSDLKSWVFDTLNVGRVAA